MSQVLGFPALGSPTLYPQAPEKGGLLEVKVCGGWVSSQGIHWDRELMLSSFFLVSSAQVPMPKPGKLLRR